MLSALLTSRLDRTYLTTLHSLWTCWALLLYLLNSALHNQVQLHQTSVSLVRGSFDEAQPFQASESQPEASSRYLISPACGSPLATWDRSPSPMSSAVMDYRPMAYEVPHRKPLPQQQGAANTRLHSFVQTTSANAATQAAHSRPRTSPQMAQPTLFTSQASSQASVQMIQDQYIPSTRRTLSSATASTSSTSGEGTMPVRTNSGASSNIRRSTSSRSGNSPTSYVALMRRQKGTVWCDRAQYEDPRLAAQQRAAKQRAAMEVVGGNQAARASASGTMSLTGGVRSKIRHHGAQKASTYSPATLSGTGVPMRLSANEVDEGDSDDGESSLAGRRYHPQTDSGRSSLNSATKVQYMDGQGRPFSSGSTPTNGHIGSSPPGSRVSDLADETPIPSDFTTNRRDYFGHRGGNGLSPASASSEERESSFGRVGQMPQRRVRKEEEERKTSDELRRRGSVDDRTMTMGGGRLFVANPDLSD